jgi:thiamine biosynthesis protein ThiS
MKITINGESREVPEGLTVSSLLDFLKLAPNRVAVERNRDIVSRAKWQETAVETNDSYEIVHFVGGG